VSSIAYRYKAKKDLTGIPYDQISIEEEKDTILNTANEPEAFLFILETAGVMSPRLVIEKALECLIQKLERFRETVERGERIQWLSDTKMLQMQYKGETHTLGNLISSVGLEMIDDSDFIGYRTIHPMFDEIIIRFKSMSMTSLKEHVDALLGITKAIHDVVGKLLASWKVLA
jgi:DNA-directed RNA polymerase subunit L